MSAPIHSLPEAKRQEELIKHEQATCNALISAYIPLIKEIFDFLSQFQFSTHETSTERKVQDINIEDVIFGDKNTIFNLNNTEEDIAILADNIKTTGLLEPIIVAREGNKFLLLSGERRTKAYIYNKERKIPAFVFENKEEYEQIKNLYQKCLQTTYNALTSVDTSFANEIKKIESIETKERG